MRCEIKLIAYSGVVGTPILGLEVLEQAIMKPPPNPDRLAREVAMMIRDGLATKEIAEVLKVSGDTVATYRHNIRRKIGILGEKASLRAYLSEL